MFMCKTPYTSVSALEDGAVAGFAGFASYPAFAVVVATVVVTPLLSLLHIALLTYAVWRPSSASVLLLRYSVFAASLAATSSCCCFCPSEPPDLVSQ